MEEAAVMMTGLDPSGAEALAIRSPSTAGASAPASCATTTCRRRRKGAAHHLLSYTDYVNRNVWHKPGC